VLVLDGIDDHDGTEDGEEVRLPAVSRLGQELIISIADEL
jgi:hypothetical protein